MSAVAAATAAAVAAANAGRAGRQHCQQVIDAYDASQASPADMRVYAQCVERLHPEPVAVHPWIVMALAFVFVITWLREYADLRSAGFATLAATCFTALIAALMWIVL